MALKAVLRILELLLIAQVGAAVNSGRASVKRDLDAVAEEYDYIIVGGGTSGLVVANRLSEHPDMFFLVIEYGDISNTTNVTVPFFATYDQSPRLYNVTSVPQIHLGNRTSRLRIGAAVGGGSSVNGMAWDRGSVADYDAWQALGNPGWGWDAMLKYFRKSSAFEPPSKEYVDEFGYQWSPALQARSWVEDVKVAKLRDGAEGDNVGIAWLPQNSGGKNGIRSSSETAYYNPVSDRENLHLIVRHYGGAVTFEGNSTAGIDVASRDGSRTRFVRSKNVILAAGAVNTPRILQLSGIGPSSLLERLGIEVKLDLPGVGANFQDHPSVSVGYHFSNNTPANPMMMMMNSTFYNQSWAEYQANKTGPHTHAWGNWVVFTSLQDLDGNYQQLAESLSQQQPLQYLPRVYAENPTLAQGYMKQRDALRKQFLDPKSAVVEITFGGAETVPVALQKPLSRGTIVINTTNPDPSVPPLVDFNTIANPIDSAIMVRGISKARAFMLSPSLSPIAAVEVTPGPGASSDAQIEDIMRRSWLSSSFDHPAGTAAMMPREWGGVVDNKLRVYGVEGLWVVDSSMMPILPAAHTQATVYAVAEHAADLIKSARNQTGGAGM